MAHERYTRTNQKLYFAGVALTNWQRAEASEAIHTPGRVQAEREACLFHLYGALLGLCHEVAGYYRLPMANATSVELLLARAAAEVSPSPELCELIELAEQSDSWLACLLKAYAGLFEPPHAPVKPKTDPTVPLIETVALDEGVPPLSPSAAEAWREQLKALVLRYRESLAEW